MKGRKVTMIQGHEIDFIKKNYLTYSVAAIAEHLDRSEYIVRYNMRKEKLIVPKELKMKRLDLFEEKRPPMKRQVTFSEYEKTIMKYI